MREPVAMLALAFFAAAAPVAGVVTSNAAYAAETGGRTAALNAPEHF